MQIGTIKRTKPRLRVLRGYPGNEPTALTASAPVKDGVTIKSGQTIQLTWNGTLSRYEWELGCSGTKIAYFAEKDSTDEDVLEADSLTGLSSAGKYELETAFFKAGDTYNNDVPLTFDGTTGDVKATTYGSGAPIVGVVSRIHGPKNLAGVDSSATTLDVIVFNTGYQVNPA